MKGLKVISLQSILLHHETFAHDKRLDMKIRDAFIPRLSTCHSKDDICIFYYLLSVSKDPVRRYRTLFLTLLLRMGNVCHQILKRKRRRSAHFFKV